MKAMTKIPKAIFILVVVGENPTAGSGVLFIEPARSYGYTAVNNQVSTTTAHGNDVSTPYILLNAVPKTSRRNPMRSIS
jgi:hypothetical protein